jgi:Ti-type conjugative transfer relaxase TraA
VIYSQIILPPIAPAWMSERDKLWNAVELFEKRKDASYAREIEVSLPVELSLEQQKELLNEFITDNFVNAGMIADYSIHDVDSHNPHAHIMLTMRPVEENSFGKKAREWNDKALFLRWREQWAAISNKHLALSGFDKKISHQSHADQLIDLEPTIHRGYMKSENLEKLDRFQKMKAIKARNYENLLINPAVALQLLTNHESIFSHHDLCRFVNERTDSVQEFSHLKIAIETCDSLVHLGNGIDGKEYYTSSTVLQQEHDLIERAMRLSSSKLHQLNPKRFEFVLASRTLNEEQQNAFNHILSGNDLSFVVGFAGTGKSYLMDAVREAYQAKGYRVLGTALAGRAADNLKQSAHIESRTIARFLIDWENGREQLTNETVLIIDEIGMVGTRQMQALLMEAERVGAKVIGCGDPEQIPPIEAGCPFRFLLERISHVFLKQVIRQKTLWQREATVELSTRQHGKAIDRYQTHGYVHEHSTREEAMTSIVDRWQHYQEGNLSKSALILTYRNVDVLALNLMARERMKSNGKLVEDCAQITTKAFGELEFASGDRIMFLRNEKSLNVKNGLLGRIDHISDSILSITMDRGDTIVCDTRFYTDLGYGYAATIHKSQGDTIDQSYVLATPQLNRFLANVALDRHRDNVELHYAKDDFLTYSNLKRTLSRGESKVLAVEFAQARGLEYDVSNDKAAHVESQTDFDRYFETIIAESVPIEGTLAERYLQNQGIENINLKSIQFHPAVWNREMQSFLPALVAKAVGDGHPGIEVKGVQVTFLDPFTVDKAVLSQPVRYSGSTDAIIMLQKPTHDDSRWYVAADIETALTLVKAMPDARVACLASQEQFNKNPLHGKQNELIFCSSNYSHENINEKAATVFHRQGFSVRVANLSLNHTHENIKKSIHQAAPSTFNDRSKNIDITEIEL